MCLHCSDYLLFGPTKIYDSFVGVFPCFYLIFPLTFGVACFCVGAQVKCFPLFFPLQLKFRAPHLNGKLNRSRILWLQLQTCRWLLAKIMSSRHGEIRRKYLYREIFLSICIAWKRTKGCGLSFASLKIQKSATQSNWNLQFGPSWDLLARKSNYLSIG